MSFDEPLQLVSTYALSAGFAVANPDALRGAPGLPDGSAFWRSGYAQLLVLKTEEREASQIRRLVQSGQEWLDLSCMNEERGGSAAVDGYLLLLLAHKPSGELDSAIRSIELDPVACRKHVAWPEDGDNAEVAARVAGFVRNDRESAS